MVPSERVWVSSCRPSIQIIPLSSLICPKFFTGVLGGGCEPQSLGREGRTWSQMEPFERALVSPYRPSIVTFPLSLVRMLS